MVITSGNRPSAKLPCAVGRGSRHRFCRMVGGLAILSLTAGLPVATAAAAELAAPAHAGPRIEFPVSKHDFGSVAKGDVVRVEFKVRNTGTAPLEIIDVRPACGCTTAGEWTKRIEPGGTGLIPIQLDTAQFTGPVAKTVTIMSNDAAHPMTVIDLTATIWAPILISQPVVVFPAITQLDQVVSRTVTLRHQVDGPLQLTALQSDHPMFRPVLKEIVPGREFELTLTTVPPLHDGTTTGRITLKSSNPKMPEVTIQAVVTVLPAVQITPTELVLTTRKLVAAEKKYVVVLNHRGGDLKLSELKTNLEGVPISTLASPDGKQFTITLTFPAGFEIPPTGTMFFSGKTNHPDHPAFEVPIVFLGPR